MSTACCRLPEVGLDGQQGTAGVAGQGTHVPLPQARLRPAVAHLGEHLLVPVRGFDERCPCPFPVLLCDLDHARFLRPTSGRLPRALPRCQSLRRTATSAMPNASSSPAKASSSPAPSTPVWASVLRACDFAPLWASAMATGLTGLEASAVARCLHRAVRAHPGGFCDVVQGGGLRDEPDGHRVAEPHGVTGSERAGPREVPAAEAHRSRLRGAVAMGDGRHRIGVERGRLQHPGEIVADRHGVEGRIPGVDADDLVADLIVGPDQCTLVLVGGKRERHGCRCVRTGGRRHGETDERGKKNNNDAPAGTAQDTTNSGHIARPNLPLGWL